MHLDTYELIVAAIVYSENDKRVGCRPYQLLEHLRFALSQTDEQHNAILAHIEHTKKYVIELRLSCETRTSFVVIIQNERRDEKQFYCEQCLEANRPENYVLDIGDSKSRTVTIYRLEEEINSSKTEKVRREKGEEFQGDLNCEYKTQKNGNFLKRLWRNRAGSTHQVILSQCSLSDWHQNPLSTVGNSSIVTYRILPKPELKLERSEIPSSLSVNNELFELTKSILEADAELNCEASSDHPSNEYNADIADVGDAILDHTFSFCYLTHLSKRILILAALLDWSHPRIPLSPRAIPHAIAQLRACTFPQISHCRVSCEILSHYSIEYTKKKLEKCRSASLFPPLCTNSLHFFNKIIESAFFLCGLEIWQSFPDLSPIHPLRAEIKAMIEADVSKWIPECDSDLTLAVLSFSSSMHQFSKDYIAYFNRFGISYSEIVFTKLDPKLTECGQRMVKKMLKQLNSHNDEELEIFTKINMKLFEAYKNLTRFALDAKLATKAFFLYEKWFEECTVFWTYAWRTLCRRYTLRALEEDIKSCDEKVLPSAVNFLAIHKALCEDFVHLELNSPTTALMCTLKIAMVIADDLIIYAKRMQSAAKQFETPKVLLAANSIEHTKMFALTRARELLEFTKLLSKMPTVDSAQASSSFDLMMNSAAQKWLRSVLSTERADHLLGYLDTIASQLSEILFPRLCSVAHHQLLRITEHSIINTLPKGQNPGYYKQIEADCDMVRKILQLSTSDASPELNRCLYLNSLSTEHLILQYYTQLAELTENCEIEPNVPVVRLRIGYVRTSNQRITIHVHVVNASNIPILDTLSQSSDPFCRIELMPRFFFPLSQFPPQITVTRKQNLNPVWDQKFQMTTTEETFFTNGSVLCITLLDHDLLTYNDLAGQAYLLLSRIPRVDPATKKRLTLMTLPLILPTWHQFQGVFQILVDRSAKDALAKQVCDYERYLRDYRMLPPSANAITEEHALKRQKSKKKTFVFPS